MVVIIISLDKFKPGLTLSRTINMFKKPIFYFALILSAGILSAAKDPFTGTWCIGNQRLVIDFIGADSIHISSRADESINGRGTFIKDDTTFTATLINDELELKMGYRYKLRDEKRLKAKITFFTVDGDSVDHPDRWLRMEKCNPDEFDFEAAEKENVDEN